MKKIIISILVMFGMFVSGSVFAKENIINLLTEKDQITITGEGTLKRGELVTLMCVKDGVDIKELSDENLPQFVETAFSDGTKFTKTVKFPESMIGGRYYIYASGESFEANSYFMFVDYSDVEEIIKKINSAKSESDIGNILDESDFGLDVDLYEKNKSIVNKIIYNGIKDGYTADEFIKALNCGYFSVYAFEGNTDSAFLSFNTYLDDETLKAEYNSLDSKTDFSDIFKKGDFDNDTVTEIIKKSFLSAKIKNATDWRSVKNYILFSDSGEVTEEAKEYFDFSDYNGLNDKNSVFQYMIGYTDEITSFSDLKKLFEDTAKNKLSAQSKPSQSGSSGSGGGNGGGGLSIGMTAPVTTPAEKTEEKPKLTDIAGHWAEQEIGILVNQGIISGYSDMTFMPDKAVTRAEFIKMVCIAFGITNEGEISFDDVSENAWYYKYIKSAYIEGIVTGKGTGFDPDGIITRQDASVVLYRFLNNIYPMKDGTLSFIDKSDISDYAQKSVAAMKTENIINGMDNNRFNPKASLTRAQCAVLMNKCMERFNVVE